MNQSRFVMMAATLLLGTYAGAQIPAVTPNANDAAAAKASASRIIHPMPANTAAGATLKEANHTAINTVPTTPFRSGAPRYLGDLSYQGGSYVVDVQSHAIYLLNTFNGAGCNISNISSCWGNPEGFFKSLAGSDFIHVVDQYTGQSANNRYTNGADAAAYFPGNNLAGVTFTDADMVSIVHAVASGLHYPTGYGNLFHVFLPPGTDECFTSAKNVCYSPDNPNTFYYCAYHGSVDFTDIGHVLYSVEPYQNVAGCNVAPGSPNGALVDSTNNVLSHETFETITDPDGDAWWNAESLPLYGSEIGDECSFIIFLPSGVYFDPPAFKISGKTYAVQSEYSNKGHSCATSTDE